jgi:mitogen-activated protein kinase organizer 1
MTGSNDRTVKLWNPHKDDIQVANQGLLIKTYSGSHGYGILDLAISKDNSKFVSAGGDKYVP